MADNLPPDGLDDVSDIDLDKTEDFSEPGEKKAGKPGWLKALMFGGPVLGLAAVTAALCMSMLDGASAATDTKKEKEEKVELEDPGKKLMLAIGELVVNLDGDRARRFVKIDAHLELESKEIKTFVEAPYNTVRIRDMLVSLLSAKELDDVSGPDSKARLRGEIRSELNKLLNLRDGIVQVYFSNFQIQ